jgi:hypothetical protein
MALRHAAYSIRAVAEGNPGWLGALYTKNFKEDSSFSEEKEAKRLLFLVVFHDP